VILERLVDELAVALGFEMLYSLLGRRKKVTNVPI
jgi:hypothetical protein